jgi:hypothetical protein
MVQKNNAGFTEHTTHSDYVIGYKPKSRNKGLYTIEQYKRPGDANRITGSIMIRSSLNCGILTGHSGHHPQLYGESFSTPVMMAALSVWKSLGRTDLRKWQWGPWLQARSCGQAWVTRRS